MTMCTGCGGMIAEPGKLYGWAGKWCHCWRRPAGYIETENLPPGFKFKPANRIGWTCPNCGQGNSPEIQQCPCIPPKITCDQVSQYWYNKHVFKNWF